MKTNSLQPQLRFPEFSGDWESRMIKDFAEVSTGNKDTQNKIENGLYPFYVRSNTIERINSYSFDGEAVLTAGDGVGVGKVFHYINDKFDFHQRVYAIYNFNSVIGKFFYQVFSERFYKKVIKLSAKNSVDSVRRDFITKMEISIPSLPEQQKIADYLSSIDEKINLLTEKKTELSRYKKAMMQQLFSQQIRFKPTNGHAEPVEAYPDWEEKRLGEIASRVKSKNKGNNQNILTISGVKGLINQFDYYNNQYAAKDVTNYYLIEKDDFSYNKSYSKGYPFGAIKRLNKYDKGVLSTLYICFRFDNKQNFSFFEHFFESGSFNKNLYKICVEGARNHGLLNVGIDDFFNEKISIPCLEEQQKISDFLSAIDESIDKVKEQITQTQSFKKAMLQQMFV